LGDAVKAKFLLAAVFAAGIVFGALLLEGFQRVSSDSVFQKQKAELAQLQGELEAQETSLAASRQKVEQGAAVLHQKVTAATSLATEIVASQGSAVERLKKVAAVLKQLENELKAP
jgi:septal ring factor EnvC (AmiA/AmiB activator)